MDRQACAPCCCRSRPLQSAATADRQWIDRQAAPPCSSAFFPLLSILLFTARSDITLQFSTRPALCNATPGSGGGSGRSAAVQMQSGLLGESGPPPHASCLVRRMCSASRGRQGLQRCRQEPEWPHMSATGAARPSAHAPTFASSIRDLASPSLSCHQSSASGQAASTRQPVSRVPVHLTCRGPSRPPHQYRCASKAACARLGGCWRREAPKAAGLGRWSANLASHTQPAAPLQHCSENNCSENNALEGAGPALHLPPGRRHQQPRRAWKARGRSASAGSQCGLRRQTWWTLMRHWWMPA